MKSTVSEKGQVTIPKQLRDRLGIAPGQELDFTDEGGALVARKVRGRGAVDAIYGILSLPGGTDAVMDELRGSAELP
ncbi:MAG: AbrB/MazE/SpoVT family DNA-binding domain-containing protein [Pseudonocardia sp.]|nr:AbrB/MazE/SpoVT family DNA-binding domain-containing protein [Pseudonocardia sp.]